MRNIRLSSGAAGSVLLLLNKTSGVQGFIWAGLYLYDRCTFARLYDQLPRIDGGADHTDLADADLWKWNGSASGSFGSMLMQMQKEGLSLDDDVVDLDPPSSPKNESSVESDEIDAFEQTQIDSMDWETARELDDSVYRLPGSDFELRESLTVLPLGGLYRALLQGPTKELEDNLLSLSKPEHYSDRIDRDRRLLAVSIASSTETVGEWRVFCQEKGGLFPLLQTVREGARSIRQSTSSSTSKSMTQPSPASSEWLGWLESNRQEEAFQAACSACRALRDLCAISPEVSAVLTDGILRANAAWQSNLMLDFRVMLQYVNEYYAESSEVAFGAKRKSRREARMRCKLYITQLLLAMTVASDDAVTAIRKTEGLSGAILSCSSYAPKERRRRWVRYPAEVVKWIFRKDRTKSRPRRRPFMQAVQVSDDLNGQVQKTANQVLAAIGHNQWIPKIPGQKGLRILSLDGGGSRGMAAVTAVHSMFEAIGNDAQVVDSFDLIAGTSTGGIIAFLTGLRQETSGQAVERYNQLIKQIFVKSALSTPLMFFTTATYDESPFMDILSKLLQDAIMLDSRADPAVPLVFCVTSKMSSTPTHVSLFRNYNYGGGELPDPFTIDPDQARADLKLALDLEHEHVRSGSYTHETVAMGSPGVRVSAGSRHPGSFRVLQRYALRASTAAPTVFKPVMMGGEMYCDGGIVASNPTSVAIHEARTLFPDIPIELVVSVGTGGFLEQKSAPRIGWDGIIGQIVNSATDGEQIHHILEDILGSSALLGRKSSVSRTKYYRFNPVIGLPDEFPIDVTDPQKLSKLRQITRDYMNEPVQKAKLEEIGNILRGRKQWRSLFFTR